MVVCPEDLDMEKVRTNVDEFRGLIASRKAAKEAEPQHELNYDEGN